MSEAPTYATLASIDTALDRIEAAQDEAYIRSSVGAVEAGLRRQTMAAIRAALAQRRLTSEAATRVTRLERLDDVDRMRIERWMKRRPPRQKRPREEPRTRRRARGVRATDAGAYPAWRARKMEERAR